MRLLIVTQKVNKNDSVLGFFHEWIAEFAKHAERVTVVCLEKGEYDLPENVEVCSLGKENKRSRLRYLFRFFNHIIRRQKDNYDVVLVHMNPIYIVLAGWYWRLTRKKIALWYTHKSVDWKLWIAEKYAHIIFTASKESFRLKSSKVVVTGHGINTDMFTPAYGEEQRAFSVLSVGRISKTKGHHIICQAVEILLKHGIDTKLTLVGTPTNKTDEEYQKDLQKKYGSFTTFVGAIPHAHMPAYFQQTNVFVNASQTESLDKTILESMACGTPVVSSNDSAILSGVPRKPSRVGSSPISMINSLISFLIRSLSIINLQPEDALNDVDILRVGNVLLWNYSLLCIEDSRY